MSIPVLWATAALAIDVRIEVLAKPLAGIYAVANLIALCLILPLRWSTPRRFRRAMIGQASAFFVVLIWWNLLSPSNDRNWQADVSRAPFTFDPVDGDRVTIHNIRTFDYRTKPYRENYTSRTILISDIVGLDFALCYWGSDLIAHPIASFRFKNGAPPICFSIEARKEEGEGGSSVLGFFRQYELIYIAAEESDVIRLRTNVRNNEWAYFYKTTANPQRVQTIFRDYLRGANELIEKPQWYNALTNNCTTNLMIHVRRDDGNGASRWDWRILLPGKVDELAYEMGTIGQGMENFEEFKTLSRLDGAALKEVAPGEFSKAIRKGIPGFAPPKGISTR
jgi:hypothetical protein